MKTTIPCIKTFTVRVSCLITAIAVVTPMLAQVKESEFKESQQQTAAAKSEVTKVVVGYVAQKGSIEKATQDFIK